MIGLFLSETLLIFNVKEVSMKQITTNQRQRIAALAETLGYDLKELEFRRDGVRYSYWRDCRNLATSIDNNILDCIHGEFEDDDCGRLYFIQYLKHYDMDFPSSAHNVRYKHRWNNIPKQEGSYVLSINKR